MAANKGQNSVGWTFGRIFTGFQINDPKKKEEEKIIEKQSLITVDNDDASELIDVSYATSSALTTASNLQNQAELINDYRAMALHPEVDNAIDDVINDAVSADQDESPVNVNLDDVDSISKATKDKIMEEFDNIKELLRFDTTAYEKFRQWYVDGRSYYHVIVDENNLKKGILKLVPLDPRATKKVKEIKKEVDSATKVEKIISTREYYLYDPNYVEFMGQDPNVQKGASTRMNQRLELSTDSIVFMHSGIVSAYNNVILSNLEKARKPLNNLRMMEDALVIYRITRAPERRVFYVDVGTLPKRSAEEYMMGLINKYKTRMVYDATSGKVKNNAHQVSMMEDYWLPRREGGRGTEIQTLEAGQNLGQIDDVLYFQKKLYKSLNVPQTRIEPDATIAIGGRMAEITRDEWKFNKFVQRLRRRFSELFLELLRRQLVLKGITTPEDWDDIIKPKIKFDYTSDSYVKAEQEAEDLGNRLNLLGVIDPYVGKYFSKEYVQKKVLGMNDEDIKHEVKTIEQEIKDGLYPDPNGADEEEEEADTGDSGDDSGDNGNAPPVPQIKPTIHFNVNSNNSQAKE